MGKTVRSNSIWVENAGGIAGIKTNWQKVLTKSGTLVDGHVYTQCDYRYATEYPAATINSYGKEDSRFLYGSIDCL